MRNAVKFMTRFCWLAVFLCGSLMGTTCRFDMPGLYLKLDDDDLKIKFPGGRLEIKDHDFDLSRINFHIFAY